MFQVDLSVLPSNAQEQLIDFYQFLIEKYTKQQCELTLISINEQPKNNHLEITMYTEQLLAKLGQFIIKFQSVEELLVILITLVIDSDSEYIRSLTAELDFNSKVRALDVIFTRFAQIHELTEESPHPEFHKLMSEVQKLATRRNDIVHSFYNPLATADGKSGMERRPTRLQSSKGTRQQPHEDLLVENIQKDIDNINKLLHELEQYRLKIIEHLYSRK